MFFLPKYKQKIQSKCAKERNNKNADQGRIGELVEHVSSAALTMSSSHLQLQLTHVA
jgi:hypothetical protein